MKSRSSEIRHSRSRLSRQSLAALVTISALTFFTFLSTDVEARDAGQSPALSAKKSKESAASKDESKAQEQAKEAVEKAKSRLEKIDDLERYELWRRLAGRPEDVARLPEDLQKHAPPALGESITQELGAPLVPVWRWLRLAAFARSGYPDVEVLSKEVGLLCKAAPVEPKQDNYQALAALLALQACIEHKEFSKKKEKSKLEKTAQEICAKVAWVEQDRRRQPKLVSTDQLFRQGLLRRLALQLDAYKPTKDWYRIVENHLELLSEKKDPREWSMRRASESYSTVALWIAANEDKIKLDRKAQTALKSLGRNFDVALAARSFKIDVPTARIFLLGAEDCLKPASVTRLEGLVKEECHGEPWASLPAFGEAQWLFKEYDPFGLGDRGRNPPSDDEEDDEDEEDFSDAWKPYFKIGARSPIINDAFALYSTRGTFFEGKKPEKVELKDLDVIFRDLETLYVSTRVNSLEAAINRALDKGVAYFKSIQENNGTFGEGSRTDPLVMLAMLEAGVDREDDSMVRAMKAFDQQGTSGSSSRRSYADAVILMMLQSYYRKEQQEAGIFDAESPKEYEKAVKELRKLIPKKHMSYIDDLADFLTKGERGRGWGYEGPNTGRYYDNSASQYAVLGLKAASLLGADYKRKALEGEAKRLVKEYQPDSNVEEITVDPDARPKEEEEARKKAEEAEGEQDKKGKKRKSRSRRKSSRSASKRKIRPGGWGYNDGRSTDLQMTASGVSSLEICRDELLLIDDLDEGLRRDIDVHVQGALRWIAEGYYYMAARERLSGSNGWGDYYNMYAMERAGVLSGTTLLHRNIDWYKEGAVLLINNQFNDGSWGGRDRDEATGEVIETAFAVLFLKRRAIHTTNRPKREQEITGKRRSEREAQRRKEEQEQAAKRREQQEGSGEEKPDEEKPGEKKSGEKKPGEENPAGKMPGESQG